MPQDTISLDCHRKGLLDDQSFISETLREKPGFGGTKLTLPLCKSECAGNLSVGAQSGACSMTAIGEVTHHLLFEQWYLLCLRHLQAPVQADAAFPPKIVISESCNFELLCLTDRSHQRAR